MSVGSPWSEKEKAPVTSGTQKRREMEVTEVAICFLVHAASSISLTLLNKQLSGAVAGKRSFAVLLGQNAGGLAALLLAAAAGLVQVH